MSDLMVRESEELSAEEERQYVKGPRLSEREMNKKLEEMRTRVSEKMDKWSSKIVVSMAFTPQIKRQEGERWSENGKDWIMRNGVKESLSILQDARMPFWCPRCSLPMNHRFDRKFYYSRGHCYNCNIDIEGQMRIDGTWDAFEKRMLRENEKAFLRDKIQEKVDYIKGFRTPQIHFQDGRWEELASISDFSQLFADLEKDIDFMFDRLAQIQKEEMEEENAKSE